MINKKIIITIFLFSFCLTLIVILSLDLILKPSAEEIKESALVMVEESPNSLVQNLSSANSILRRQAIELLGVQKNVEGVSPLFLMMMSDQVNDNDSDLIIESLYKITNGKIVDKAKELLLRYALFLDPPKEEDSKRKNKAKKDQEEVSPYKNLTALSLSPKQRISLLTILSRMDKKQASKDPSLEFMKVLLAKEPEKEIINKAIIVSGQLALSLNYSSIKDLAKKDSLYRLSSIYALKQIILNDDKNQEDFNKFLVQLIETESHPLVQQESHLALFETAFKDHSLKEREVNLITYISLLNSSSLSNGLDAETALLMDRFSSKDQPIFNYFAFYNGSSLLKYRLLNILYKKKLGLWLNKEELVKQIQNRYNRSSKNPYLGDLVNISLELLGSVASSEQDLKTILSAVNDKEFLASAIKGLERASETKDGRSLFNNQNLYSNFNALIYHTDAQALIGPIIYRVKGGEGLLQSLNSIDASSKMRLFSSLDETKIEKEDLELIKEKYENFYNDSNYKAQVQRFIKRHQV